MAEHLRTEFGQANVFFDVDSISFGENFREATLKDLTQAQAVLVLIGRSWKPERLSSRDDHVHFEISQALAQGKTVLPILVDGAVMPPISELPDELAPFAYANGRPLRRDPDFGPDAARIVEDLKQQPHPDQHDGPSGEPAKSGRLLPIATSLLDFDRQPYGGGAVVHSGSLWIPCSPESIVRLSLENPEDRDVISFGDGSSDRAVWPVADGDGLLVVSGSRKEAMRLDVKTLELQSIAAIGKHPGKPLVVDRVLWLTSIYSNKVRRIDLVSGEVRKVDPGKRLVNRPTRVGSEIWVSTPKDIRRISAPTGEVIGRIKLQEPGRPTVIGNEVWVTTESGLEIYDPQSGERVGVVAVGKGYSDPVSDDEHAWVVKRQGGRLQQVHVASRSVVRTSKVVTYPSEFVYAKQSLWFAEWSFKGKLIQASTENIDVVESVPIGRWPGLPVHGGDSMWIPVKKGIARARFQPSADADHR